MSGTTKGSRGLDGRFGRLVVVLAYAAVSVAWIAFSDNLLQFLVPDEATRNVVATGKGVGFVLVTASLIWVLLLARDLRLARNRAALEASEERYRMLAERAQDVVYRMRLVPELAFEYVSPSIELLTGRSPAEHYADPTLGRDLIHPDDRDVLGRAMADGAGPVTVRWRLPDGSQRWMEHRVTPIHDASGRLVAVEGAARDVTARVEAEAKQAILQRAIEGSPVGLAVIGGEETGFDLRYVNPTLLRLTGVPAEELVGRSVFDFPDVGGPVRDASLAGRLLEGEPFEIDIAVGPPGSAVPMTFLVSPQLSASGDVESVLAFLSDRSDAEGRWRAESMLRAATDASPLAIVSMDLEGIVQGWNPAAERLLGWTADEAIGRRIPYLDDGGWEGGAERRRQLLDGTADPAVVRPLRGVDGLSRLCRVTTGVIRDAGGAPTGYVNLISDLDGEAWNSKLQRAIDHAAEAVVITDLEGSIEYVNPAFESVSGYRAAELLGRNPRILKSGVNPPSVYEEMWHRLTNGEVWRGILVNRRKDGSLYEEEATFSPVLGVDGRPAAYVGVKRDISLERRLAAGLSTELMDRAAVEDAMGRIEVRDDAAQTAQSVCEALASFGDVDNVELVVLPPGRSLAVPVACVAATIPVHLGQPLPPAFAAYLRERSVGGAWSDNHVGGHPDPRVDVPEYAGMVRVAAPVRHRGRTVGVLIATTETGSPDAWIARHLRIVSELATHAGPLLGPQLETHDLGDASADEVRRIIDRGAFSPVFQPVCDLASRQPVGWEALTRFADGTAPAQRFADARAMGLGEALEMAAAQKAIEAFAALGRSGWLSINVSPSLLLGGQGARIVRTAGAPVVLELTEQVDFDDYARLRGAVDLLDPPAKLAVDDTGAGYASLRHVLELRPDFVKLDPSFVRDIDRNDTRQAMVAGMVHYAEENGTRLVAEGIETEAERRTLLRLGVHLGQGYLLGIPSVTGAVAAVRPAAGRRLRALEAEAADADTATG